MRHLFCKYVPVSSFFGFGFVCVFLFVKHYVAVFSRFPVSTPPRRALCSVAAAFLFMSACCVYAIVASNGHADCRQELVAVAVSRAFRWYHSRLGRYRYRPCRLHFFPSVTFSFPSDIAVVFVGMVVVSVGSIFLSVDYTCLPSVIFFCSVGIVVVAVRFVRRSGH